MSMWSAFSSDLSNFAKNISAESTQFVNFITDMATDVVGQGGTYAGDEFTPQAQSTPLTSDAVRQLQQDFATYCEPFSPAEAALFATWASQSPLSSAHVHERQAAKRGGGDGSGAPAATAATAATAADFPDEPADTCRQKLLDYSEDVLDKYRALVGDAVSPRLGSPSGRSAGTASASAVATPAKDAAAAPSPAGAPGMTEGTTPTRPTQAGGDYSPLTEDTFFDRYFFRLAQRRSLEAELREQQQAEREKTAEADAAAAAEAAPEKSVEGAEGAETEGPTHRLAKRFITAANAFVNNFDEVMTGRQTGGSDEDNVDPRAIDAGWEAEHEGKVSGLEELVHELQEELRRERARVVQLTELLTASHIPIPSMPPTPQATPQKKEA